MIAVTGVTDAHIIERFGYVTCARCKKRNTRWQSCEFCGHENDYTFTDYNKQEPIMIDETSKNPVDDYDLTGVEIRDPEDLSDEETSAFDDGIDIADEQTGRPQSGIVPDAPEEH